ncbi:MAG: type II toxin-antitoxin system RelE/ParE family toxin [Candidatus Niyogibacteria bacterium]|nr:type II toxin-antitoxin system RelE/ParE family toxin [Candidatus Niyogibacteria bacterium]
MVVRHIYYHPQFWKSFERLPQDVREKAKKRINVFKEDPFSSSLDTHKLHGKLKEQWSFRVKGQWRVLFIFDNPDVIFLDIGPHHIYK